MRRFAYRLALALGQPNVDAMLSQMTYSHLLEWIAFSKLEPFGPLREDFRAGQIAAAVSNARPFRKKNSPTVYARDFFPALSGVRRIRRQTPEQMEAIVAAYDAALRAARG